MSFRSCLISMLAIIMLTACKVQIKVPAGGSVESSSTVNNCASGATCEFDVVDSFFEDTFTAKPAPGFVFKQWKKQQSYFCGGGKKSCVLKTASFDLFPELVAVLEGDSVYFLEPVFVAVGDNGSGTLGKQPASVCFNTVPLTEGTRVVSRYRSTDTSSGGVIEFEYDQITEGESSFDGRSGTKFTADVVATGDAPSTSKTTSYAQIDVANKRTTSLGVVTKVFTPQSIDTTATINPGRLDRFDLTTGQSHSQSFKTRVDSKVSGFDLTTTTSTDLTTTYLGVETITVPAGTYAACKFTDEGVNDDGQISTIRWLGVDNGQLIKQVSSATTTVFLNGSINGNAI